MARRLHDREKRKLAMHLGESLLRKRGAEWLETLYLLEEPGIRALVWELAGLEEDKREQALDLIKKLRRELPQYREI